MSELLPKPSTLKTGIKWTLLAIVAGALAGCASAFFLVALDWVTDFRNLHRVLIWLLPVGGFFVGWLYLRYGRGTEAGNNLILDEIHNPKAVVPFRMVPLVLFGTLATHFFGGSAGREGTAVQMGASIADQLNKVAKFNGRDRRVLLMAGMAAGFASVFGTPFAGAIFGLEVLNVGKLRYHAFLPCFAAAFVGHYVTLAWGVSHTHYSIGTIPEASLSLIFWSLVSGVLFGVIGFVFAFLTHAWGSVLKRLVRFAPYRPVVGGVLVAALILTFGMWRYVGLGVPVIVEATNGPVPKLDFVYKLILTVLTLGAGFKGGEVTPLFFIGATFGNALAAIIPVGQRILAGLGFVAVFGGAANVPLASAIMGMELFGSQIGVYALAACYVSYLFSGHTGIYHSQKKRKWSDRYFRR